MRSCVCDDIHDASGDRAEDDDKEEEEEEEEEEEGKDGCRASDPLVQTRWFFNPVCEGCLDHGDGDVNGAGEITERLSQSSESRA